MPSAPTTPGGRLGGKREALHGKWRLHGLLHRGAYATVFRATAASSEYDEHQPADFVVKLARCDAQRRLAIALLQREVQVATQATHAHLLPVVDWSFAVAPYYVVSPHLSGMNLEGLLQRYRPPLPASLWIVRQVADALTGLHQSGWLHGDVSPANVHVAPNGHTTLLDYGFARRLDCSSHRDQWMRTTSSVADPPEVQQGGAYTTASDIHALGLLLNQLLDRRPQPTTAANSTLLDWVRQRLLNADPSQRATAQQARRELLAWEVEAVGRE